MNIVFIKHFILGFMVSEIPRVSVSGHCQYSVTLPYNEMKTSSVYRCIHSVLFTNYDIHV